MSDFSNRDIDTTVLEFEAALSARKFDIPDIRLARILVALDGSNQDRSVLDLSRAMATRFGARLLVTYAPEQAVADLDGYVSRAAAELRGAGFEGEPVLPAQSGRAFNQILEVARKEDAELIAFPSPYLEDFRDLGGSSVGTTTDMLLHRRTGPLLIVRKPAENVREQLEDVIVPLGLLSDAPEEIAGWAIEVAPSDGLIQLVAVADQGVMRSLGRLIGAAEAGDLDSDRLAALGDPETAGFIGAVQRRAAEAGIQCRVRVEEGELVSAVSAVANEQPCLLLIGCGAECAGADYQDVAALVRQSRNPVLVV